MLPTANNFKNYMIRLNIKLSDHVVLYDTHPVNVQGFRTAWMFKVMGHQNVSVLDGGLNEWIKEGLPVAGDTEEAHDKQFNYKIQPDLQALYDEVAELTSNDKGQIIDTRPAPMYAQGHIPGAINIPHILFFDQPGMTLKSAEERIKIFKEHGIDLNQDVITSCQMGITSSLANFALTDICQGKVKNFDGSYLEYNMMKQQR